jgi:hypothetical protein
MIACSRAACTRRLICRWVCHVAVLQVWLWRVQPDDYARAAWIRAEVYAVRRISGVADRLAPAQVGGVPEPILLRVFFCTAGRKIILLVSGYDKARDPSDRRQQREIARARKLLTAHREALRRAGKRR